MLEVLLLRTFARPIFELLLLLLGTVLHLLQLESQRLFEKDLVCVKVLLLHAVQILDGEAHDLGIDKRHHRKLPLQHVLVRDPVV